MTSHDDAARDTANARADAAAALGVRLKAMTAERNTLLARIDRVEAILIRGYSDNGGLPGDPLWLDDLLGALRGNR